MLRKKNILVGVTGSIAAYKSAILIRQLVKEGANVKVIMTPSASDFISPLTLSTLSKNPVSLDFFNSKSGEWASHVDLGLWADLYIIAPATANSIAKFANGICEDLLAAVYLSARCPVFIAAAMDLDMYKHKATSKNISILKSFGNYLIEADHGELASGLVGEGRMAEPEKIVAIIRGYFSADLPLVGKKVLVTAGPTHEAIDPVRFIGNNSSGKMGYAIAEDLAQKGATVTLISGPTSMEVDHTNINLHRVTSSDEMFQESQKAFPGADIVVLAAAVADYQPIQKAKEKIKKDEKSINLELTKTIDIAATLGKNKKKGQFIVGFALETENELTNAQNKIKKKNFDLIVLNSLKDRGAGFGHNTNKVTIIDAKGKLSEFGLKSKKEVAKDIVNEILNRIHV